MSHVVHAPTEWWNKSYEPTGVVLQGLAVTGKGKIDLEVRPDRGPDAPKAGLRFVHKDTVIEIPASQVETVLQVIAPPAMRPCETSIGVANHKTITRDHSCGSRVNYMAFCMSQSFAWMWPCVKSLPQAVNSRTISQQPWVYSN